ncbi:MAG: ABC transporter permease [Dehalococcoidales bacterium]|jgi:peptide/nickel transport system permease protein|nr:ABC transporter permease [Dehalococcoidales bacterium]
MTAYIVRRLIMAAIIIILVSLIVFFAIRLLPGDPLVIFIGKSAQAGTISIAQMDALREKYGLNDPILVQYAKWAWGIIHGNLGESINYKTSVGKLMAERFPVTLHLGIMAFIFNIVFGVLLGLIAAVRRGTWIDNLVTFLANIGVSIPQFWLAILMIIIFGIYLNWLPVTGYTSPFDNFWMSTKQVIMPVFCMAVTMLATTARLVRSSMLEVVRQDYIRTAWAKGLRERTVILRHALKNGLIPVFTMIGIDLSMVFAGSVLVETVFAIPGVGRLLVTSVFAQDYVVVQSGTLVIAMIIVIANLVVDISYGWLDPRIRYS